MAELTKNQLNILDNLSIEMELYLNTQCQVNNIKGTDNCADQNFHELMLSTNVKESLIEIAADKSQISNKSKSMKTIEQLLSNDLIFIRQFEQSLKETVNDFQQFSINYNCLVNEMKSFIEKTKPILYDQKHLLNLNNDLETNLNYFQKIDKFDPAILNSIQSIIRTLNEIEQCAEYFYENSDLKEHEKYSRKNAYSLTRTFDVIRTLFQNSLNQLNEKISFDLAEIRPNIEEISSLMIHLSKYVMISSRFRPLICELETLSLNSNNFSINYESFLDELIKIFVNKRSSLLLKVLADEMNFLIDLYINDKGILFQQIYLYFNKIIMQEINVFSSLFSNRLSNESYENYLLKIGNCFYDNLRTIIICMNHIEILSEVFEISTNELNKFFINDVNICRNTVMQLIEDIQDRFLFRTHIFVECDILNFQPGSGDLAYPQKLYVIYMIVQSNSDTDFLTIYQGYWYPTIKKTFHLLFLLRRIINDEHHFNELLSEIIVFCLKSLEKPIVHLKNNCIIDGELFEIMHLLIIREQLIAFRSNSSNFDTIWFDNLCNQINTNINDSQDIINVVDKNLKRSCLCFIENSIEFLIKKISFFNKKELENYEVNEYLFHIVNDDWNSLKNRIDQLLCRMKLYLVEDNVIAILFRLIKKQFDEHIDNFMKFLTSLVNHDISDSITMLENFKLVLNDVNLTNIIVTSDFNI